MPNNYFDTSLKLCVFEKVTESLLKACLITPQEAARIKSELHEAKIQKIKASRFATHTRKKDVA